MTSGESDDEIVEFMLWFKAHVRKEPQYFTIDLKPGMDIAILAVFPAVKIITCTFHAVKLLIGGLSKELNRLQRVNHGILIKECKEVRRISLKMEKEKFTNSKTMLNQDTCQKWLDFYNVMHEICKDSDMVSFKAKYFALIGTIKAWNKDIGMKYTTLLSAALVNNEITQKGMLTFKKSMKTILGVCKEKDTVALEKKYISMIVSITAWNSTIWCKSKESLPIEARNGEFTKRSITGVKKALKAKWRAILLDLRKEMEEKKSQFARIKHMLLKKPKHVMPWEMESMNEFFTANAWAQEIRKVVIQFYELLDDPSRKVRSFSFLDALITEDCHEQLKSSIETLNTKHKYIFNYLDAWKYKRA